MIRKLDRWAWLGGAVLAVIAGMVNAVGFLSYARQAVTHLTGTTTQISIALAQRDHERLAHLLCVVLSFMAGAALSGFIVQHQTLRLGRRYGVTLFIESLLLAAAAYLMRTHSMVGSYFASAACGLQNAMASTYSGTVLRTTHLSGMFTDLGAALGHWLRRIEVDKKRMNLCAMLIAAFFVGGGIGTWLYERLGSDTLYVPAVMTGVVSVSYSLYAHFKIKADRAPPSPEDETA